MEYQQIADKIGVHPVTLSKWLNGHSSPGKLSMLRIQDELGWPVAEQMEAFNTIVEETGKDMYGPRFKEFLRDKHNVVDRLMA
ncbi:MAG TPA: helix-turn-helix transcriptional regulator [Gemmatimonadales bacterium]|nr:helix-turn-helix transcriptional regulator [Gemmatimonadales bacterium]